MERAARRRWHEVWKGRCEAAGSIRVQHGVASAFDHVVGEKLPNFAEAAEERPGFSRALPQLVSELRRMFTPEEIEERLARIESARLQRAMEAMDVHDPQLDDLAASDAEAQRFESVKELLTAPALGTSQGLLPAEEGRAGSRGPCRTGFHKPENGFCVRRRSVGSGKRFGTAARYARETGLSGDSAIGHLRSLATARLHGTIAGACTGLEFAEGHSRNLRVRGPIR